MQDLPHLAAIRLARGDARFAEGWRTTQLLRERTHGGLALSVPADWSEDLGWKEGTMLAVTRLTGGRLLVTLEGDQRPVPSVVIDLDPEAPREHVFRRLVSAYLGGTDEIAVRSSPQLSPTHLLVVREFLRRVSDFQVSFETKGSIVLRGTAGTPTSDPASLVQKMHQRVVSLHQEAGRSWAPSPSEPGVHAFATLDDEVDREAWLMERTLVRGWAQGMYFGISIADASAGVNYLMVAKTLERIADHAVRIGEEGRRLVGGPEELLVGLSSLHQKALEFLVAAGEVLRQPETSSANRLVDGVEEVVRGREAILKMPLRSIRGKSSRGGLVVPISLILESIVRTASYVADLGEIALDLQANL